MNLGNLPTSLEETAKAYARQAEAPNTRRAYRSDWQIFVAWCDTHGYPSLPAAASTVALFLANEAQRAKPSTVARRVMAIRFVHRLAGYAPPWDDKTRQVYRGIRRAHGTAPAHKAPLTADLVRQMLAVMPASEVRDRALLLVGFAGAFRRSELAGLRRSDIEIVPEGVIVVLRRSKTDQEGQGQAVAIPWASEPSCCPVRALQVWMEQAPNNVLFPGVDQIARTIRRWAMRAGLEARQFSPHSLRSGFVTSAALSGQPLLQIMQHSRHKDVRSAQRYFHGEKFKHHPGAKLL